ncbi:MAG: hypothetical protein WCO28_12205, partial [Bacteroidota bacterium]
MKNLFQKLYTLFGCDVNFQNQNTKAFVNVNQSVIRLSAIILLAFFASTTLTAQVSLTASAGTTSGSYSTLKDAFDAVNAGTHQSVIVITITGNTTELSTASLNASGTGSSSYSSINIYPTSTGYSISGNLSSPLIDLNGAQNVTIDGRVNASGSTQDLVISNTSTSNTSGTSTIRFINDASGNTIKYCTLKGSSTASNGILFFSTSTGSAGNNNNTIDNNNITNSADANRPVNAIYSLGTVSNENTGNTISNNNIYDFLNRGLASNGIYLNSNTTTWSITNNSFYETGSFIPTASVGYNAIFINNTSGNNFTISDNFIGGSATSCGGSSWAKTNAYSNQFFGLYLNVGTGTASNVQGNTIKNFDYSNATNANWIGIYAIAGDVNIGTTTSNVIGSTTGTGSIVFTSTATANFYGIYISSTGTIDIQNNSIGSISLTNSASYATNFSGIKKSASAGTTTINNNTIGSASTSNSVNASSTSSTVQQTLYGIISAGSGNVTISGNTIANITNGTTNTNAATIGVINGIHVSDGANVITNNTVHHLLISNANNSLTQNASVIGIIDNSGSSSTQNVSGNTIYNLSNTYSSFIGNVIGLYYSGPTTASAVSKNLIYNLSVDGGTTNATIYGIKIDDGATTYSNNIITLSGNTTTNVYGFFESGAIGNNNNLYFNTVYLGGVIATGSNKSYALYSDVTTNTRNLRNNIFSNTRSTSGGSNLHYAAWFNYTISTGLTLDYNDYYVSGIGGVLGYYNSSNVSSLPLITGKDAGSFTVNPSFASAGGTSAANYLPSASMSGITISGITTDFPGTTRLSTPEIGAYELACVNPSISSQSTLTQSQCLGIAFSAITVSAAGTSLSYQWYSNTLNSNSGGVSLGTSNGAQTNSYTPQSNVAGTLYYYCVVTGTCGSPVSSAISGAFTVNALPTPSITGSASVCENVTG